MIGVQHCSSVGGAAVAHDPIDRAAVAMRWRDFGWWATCQEAGGRHWKHGKCNWFMAAEDAVAELFGPN